MESNREKQPELYMHRAPSSHSVQWNNRRDLDKYATRLIKGSSAKEAFVSSFSFGDLNIAIYILKIVTIQLQKQEKILRP